MGKNRNWLLKKREILTEIIDLGPAFYTQEEYHDCLMKLGNIGEMLGGNFLSMKAFKKVSSPIKSILDVGCGGGYFTKKLAEIYTNAKVIGVDTSYNAIEFANSYHKKPGNLHFVFIKNKELNFPDNKFDVVTSTLVCHHMEDEEMIDFCIRAFKIAKKAVIINDLVRSPLAYWLFALIAPVLFNNRLIKHDGLISIRRGFIREDLRRILHRAGICESRYQIRRCFPFRWIVRINCER